MPPFFFLNPTAGNEKMRLNIITTVERQHWSGCLEGKGSAQEAATHHRTSPSPWGHFDQPQNYPKGKRYSQDTAINTAPSRLII